MGLEGLEMRWKWGLVCWGPYWDEGVVRMVVGGLIRGSM